MSTGGSPLVSVVLPAYNAEGTVQRSIDSLLQQTLRDIEIVVVNDGSTDSTAAIVSSLAASDPRVRVIDRSENRGLVHSLQEGLGAAQAPLVARLDSDDVAHPTRLERQVREFGDPDVVLCATAYRRIRPDGRSIRDAHPPVTHGAMAAALLDGNRICHSSVMFRREVALAVGGYQADWYPAEDYDLWLRLMNIGRFAGIDDVLVDYLENDLGVSNANSVVQEQRLAARRAEYRTRLLGADVSPTGSPRTAHRVSRAISAQLTDRGLSDEGLDAQCYSMAAGGPGSVWWRRLRLLTAPTLVWRGRRR